MPFADPEVRKQKSRSYYLKNKEEYIRRAKAQYVIRKEKYDKLREGLSCMECGESRPWVLDFHHRDPTQKDICPSRCNSRSWKRLLEEIAKCDVLCATCHRDRHHRERNEDS